ncbi:DUF3320 domain-containing protein [Rhizobium sp. A22-96]
MQGSETSNNETQEIDLGGRPKNPAIVADVAASFTYASYQNAVPVIRSILIENNTDRHVENCRIELTSSPSFLRPKSWTVDRLIPGDRLPLIDRKVEFDASYLAGLNEAERGEITLRLSSSGEILDEQRLPVRLLARDEWGGVDDMAQLLPAFVMPNDPGVAQILRTAAETLVAHGHPGGLDGYQSQNPQRAYMLAAAAYSAIAGMGLHYAEPPVSFESRGQKIRRPSTIAEERLATCLDTTLLFSAGLEAAGLHPVILMFNGHAAVGVWLIKRTFAHAIETDQMEVRKALASRELIVFETTGVTHRPSMTLESAQRALDSRLGEEEAQAFVAAIDVRRSRSGGIMPLASHEPIRRNVFDDETASVADLPLPSAPNVSELPAETIEVKPTSAAGRIDRWQKKLLDLTLRNRLLNFPDSKKTIPFLCTDVSYLEDRLANGAAIRIISLPEQNPLGERDAALYRDVHGRDLQRGFAAEALLRDELPSPLDARQLEPRLIDLYRQVRNDFAEGGANTLFLAVGFLRWRKKPDDERSYRAPLLLVPVKLERRSASSRFTIRFHEDEPRFNATLLQFLERDFDVTLPQFGGDLPLDDSGVDVPRILAMMRQAIRDVPGMEVVDETALSTFSFAKFLMWKDLVERTEALRENRVVRHLIDTPEAAFQEASGQGPFRDERELDRVYAPADIISLLPADSSQTAASLAAAEGRDFVIVGPPGTGKSQTIANMIANCLAVGKTVLFVAEKTAALDVVYRRLRAHGLGEHCIELHSNKADRRHFLGQLKAAWEHGGRTDASEWIAINERLRLRRDELNTYVEALHTRYPNGWTPYLALGIALKAAEAPAPALSWLERDAHDTQTLHALEDLAAELGLVFASVERQPVLDLIDVGEWSSGWQDGLLAAAQSLRNAIDLFTDSVDGYLVSLGFRPQEQISQLERQALVALAQVLQRSRGRDITIAYDRDFPRCAEALENVGRSIKAYREAEQGLAASYGVSAIRDLDPEVLDRQWREANASFWPSAMLGKRKVQKLLQGYADHGTAEPDRDLPLLRRMKECLLVVEQSPLAGKPLPMEGLATDVGAAAEILELAREFRAAIPIPGRDQEEIRSVLRSIAPCLRETVENDWVRQGGDRLLAAVEGLRIARQRFGEAAGRGNFAEVDGPDLTALREKLDTLVDARYLLRDWSAWCRIRNRAIASNLSSLVEQIEKETIRPDEARAAFRLGYARWWLPKVLDSDTVLRNFRRFQHENAINEFREIDDLVRSHATQRVISVIAHGLPPVQSVPRNSELGLLRYQMELQRPSHSIRDMIGKMPQNFSKLAPCMLMSPLSIAQYLPPNQALFDVVIFDEASQITTWDAVGAIARARQTIIVGDPKQLPPTNFFGRNEEEEEIADHEKDLESILDEAKASGIPIRDLRWHYRSRSESLIAFSNHHYYQNRLVTFPSPAVEDRAVHLRKVQNGVYDRGKSRTNRIEAEAVAKEAVSRMKGWLKLPEKDRPTLGVITFNAQQQSLILDLLDAARRDDPELEWFFAEERVEPTIVKNLENVQGDERDVILFSITFWKDAAGKLTMDFGALNRDGGERRLNVAVTRARQELIVFSGFTADQIDPARAKGLAIQHLKTFLDYAERGAIALPAQDIGSVGGFDSSFEEAVAVQLERRGWSAVPQVGISGFRIDLGVRHPDLAGTYLAGVECDGATYHSSATARDRDKVREQVLRGLGWNMLRVWSTDWWFDAAGCMERLHANLERLLEESRARRIAEQDDIPTLWNTGHEEIGINEIHGAQAAVPSEETTPPSVAIETEFVYVETPVAFGEPKAAEMQLAAAPAPDETVEERRYSITDLSGFRADPDQFFEFGYRDTLRGMIEAVIETESPLRADILAQRLSRAHGWLRTGGRIRERIDLHLRGLDTTLESSGEFIWKKGAISDIVPYRQPASEDARRSIADIPLAELAFVVLNNPDLLDEPDPARELARLLGVERLAAVSRSRLDEAIARARQHDSTTQSLG